jgi:spermidine synthase
MSIETANMEVNVELMNELRGSRYMESACSADSVTLYSLGECYWAGKTAFCDEVVIAESPVYGKVLFLDKEIQSAESDEMIYHEHLVHPVLSATTHVPVKKVLIVGGGEGATAREVLKWSADQVSQVDWVDLDDGLVNLCRRHLSWADDSVYNDARVHYYAEDIRAFWRANSTRYDVIILDLPDPDVEDLKAFGISDTNSDYPLYCRSFFRDLKEHLTEGGVYVSHTGPIAPGADAERWRPGMAWFQMLGREYGFGAGSPYHVFLPSFQSEWGFWMSCVAPTAPTFPTGLAVMGTETCELAFRWAPHWVSPFVGVVGGASA